MYEIKRFGAHRKVRGVISGIPLGEKLEELKKNIKGGNIVACRWSCHEYDKCGSEVIKGSNCGGSHTAAYGGCPARKRAVVVQQVRAEKKLTYAQAIKVVDTEKKERQTKCQHLNQSHVSNSAVECQNFEENT